MVLLAKLSYISRLLIESYIIHDEFNLSKYALREYNDMKEEIRNINTQRFIKVFSLFIKQFYRIV